MTQEIELLMKQCSRRIQLDKSSSARACPYVDAVVFEACVSPLPTLPASRSRF